MYVGMLKCECSRTLCSESTTCITNFKCFRDVRYTENDNTMVVRLGCIDKIPEVNLSMIKVCSGLLDSSHYKLECCDNENMCNGDLTVSLNTNKTPTKSPSDTTEPSEDRRPTDPTADTAGDTPSTGKWVFCSGYS